MDPYLKYFPIISAVAASYMFARTLITDVRSMISSAKDSGAPRWRARPVVVMAVLVVLAWIPSAITFWGVASQPTPDALTKAAAEEKAQQSAEDQRQISDAQDTARKEKAARETAEHNLVIATQQRQATSAPPTPAQARPGGYVMLDPPVSTTFVNEVYENKDALGSIRIVSHTSREAINYVQALVRLFNRDGIYPEYGGAQKMVSPTQTGVMVAVLNLSTPPKPADLMFKILSDAGFFPRMIQGDQEHGDWYIYIGDAPL